MKKVFLGGTCNGSTWRDALIKDLQIDYFPPCADEWTPEMMKEEIKQRTIHNKPKDYWDDCKVQ